MGIDKLENWELIGADCRFMCGALYRNDQT